MTRVRHLGRNGLDQPLTAPAVRPEASWRWKKMNMISGGIVIRRTSANSRFQRVVELALEVEQRQLDRRVVVPRQEVQRVDEVVVDGDRQDDDHRDDGRPQEREDHAPVQPERRRAIHECGLVELPRDGRHEGHEDEDGKGHREGDLDEDESRQRLEEPECLEQEDRRHHGRRDDQSGEEESTDERRDPIPPSLDHEGDHRREDDRDRDRRDRQDQAVAERGDHDAVPLTQHGLEILDDLPVGRPGEIEGRSLGLGLRRCHDDEDERDDEHEEGDRQRDEVDPVPAGQTSGPHSSISRFEKNRIIG